MKEELRTFIQNLKADRRILTFDEAATKQAVILKLLSILGWDTFNIEEVTPEYPVGDKSVDYSLRTMNAKVFLEVKRIGENLEEHQEQLLNYSFQEGVKLASLTNGITWWFYLPLHEGSWEQRKFYTIDISQQDPDDIASKFIDFLSKENVGDGKAIENAEKIYKGQQKQNVLKETLPKAWNKIVIEPDESLIELINETTEKLCGFKADSETIEQFFSTYKEQFLVSDLRQPMKISKPIKRKGGPPPTLPEITYSGKKITSFSFKGSHYSVKNWKDLLVKLSEILYNTHKNEFQKALSLKGTKRNYFTYKPNELRVPRQVGDSKIFVETHWSANSTVKICYDLLSIFGHDERDLKIECY